MTTLPADPLAATTRLLVDGNNLLHALARGAAPAPRSALIGRLRGVVPASVAIDVVFDGPAEPGLRGARIAAGLRVRYSGGRSADAVLLALVDEVQGAGGPLGTAEVLVVTDDRDLRHHLRTRGARTAGTAWLLGRLERTDRAADRPPRPRRSEPHADADADAGADRTPWQPGRGATTKRGNPFRARRRHPGR